MTRSSYPSPVPWTARATRSGTTAPWSRIHSRSHLPSPDPWYGQACYFDTDVDTRARPAGQLPRGAEPRPAGLRLRPDRRRLRSRRRRRRRLRRERQLSPPSTTGTSSAADGDGLGAACDPSDTPPANPPPAGSARHRLTAPTLSLAVPRRLRLAELWPLDRGGGCAAHEECVLRAELIVKRRKVAAGTAALGGRGTTYVFMRRLQRLAPAKATLRLTATDTAGNVSTASAASPSGAYKSKWLGRAGPVATGPVRRSDRAFIRLRLDAGSCVTAPQLRVGSGHRLPVRGRDACEVRDRPTG